jgi:hypothetical protein
MRNLIKVSVLTILALSLIYTVALTSDEKWFDLEGCEMCKGIAENPKLLENMTWNQYDINNGVLAVTTVAPEFMEAYMDASKQMKMTGEKIMAGQKVELCGSCTALSGMFGNGLKSEMIATDDGSISLFTSADAELVTELQVWSSKNKVEMNKMHADMEHASQ